MNFMVFCLKVPPKPLGLSAKFRACVHTRIHTHADPVPWGTTQYLYTERVEYSIFQGLKVFGAEVVAT